jgi:hypothetical protein
MKNEIEKIENKQVSPSAENLIEKALSNNVSVETIERLLAMRKELKAEFAKEQFDLAMSGFQAECPTIKTKAGGKTKLGIIAYKYAPLDSIVEQVKPIIGKFGLSYSIKIETSEKSVKAICIVKHISGHYETSEMEAPHGVKTDIMSETQRFASTSTFVKRYAFCNAFGIMTGDDDTDANSEDKKPKATITVQGAVKQIREEKDKLKLDKYRLWLDKQTFTEAQKNVILMAINEQSKIL